MREIKGEEREKCERDRGYVTFGSAPRAITRLSLPRGGTIFQAQREKERRRPLRHARCLHTGRGASGRERAL